MASVAISGLTALGAAPASGDLLVFVDVSDTSQAPTGTTKRGTVANLFTTPVFTTSLTVSGILVANASNVTVTPAIVANGGVQVSGGPLTMSGQNIIPTSDNTCSVGTSGARFADVRSVLATINTLTVSGAATVGTTLGVTGAVTLGSTLTVGGALTIGSATLITTTVAFTNGSGGVVGTLGNAPISGNPTKWIPIVDNGTTRYIPAW